MSRPEPYSATGPVEFDHSPLTRYEDVVSAAKDYETFSSAKGVALDMVKAPEQSIPVPKVIISMDPPEHEKMRKLVSRVFTPRSIAVLESWSNVPVCTRR